MILPPLSAIIERGERFYIATCPELDVVSQGATFEEARLNIEEAVQLFLEVADQTEIARRLSRNVQITPLRIANA